MREKASGVSSCFEQFDVAGAVDEKFQDVSGADGRGRKRIRPRPDLWFRRPGGVRSAGVRRLSGGVRLPGGIHLRAARFVLSRAEVERKVSQFCRIECGASSSPRRAGLRPANSRERLTPRRAARASRPRPHFWSSCSVKVPASMARPSSINC